MIAINANKNVSRSFSVLSLKYSNILCQWLGFALQFHTIKVNINVIDKDLMNVTNNIKSFNLFHIKAPEYIQQNATFHSHKCYGNVTIFLPLAPSVSSSSYRFNNKRIKIPRCVEIGWKAPHHIHIGF